MIVFSAFLFIFSTEWSGNFGQDIKGTDDILGWDISSKSFAYDIILSGGGIFLGGVAVGGILGFVTKNHAWTGAGVLCGIIFSLFTVAMNPIENMFQSYSAFGINIWNVFTFCFTVIAIIAVMEVFTGRSVDD